MNLLLPHHFKKVGAWIAPAGFGLWLSMQLGYTTRVLTSLFGPATIEGTLPPYHYANVFIAILGFTSYLAGIYFLTFSKEQIEDEMVQRTRLDSFQFAALVQMVFVIAGFMTMLVLGDPKEGGLMLFFIAVIALFWLSFIGRFNYILHVRFRQ